MRPSRRTVAVLITVLAVAAFAVVQDRVTAAGARRYAALARAAVARGDRPPAIESIMAPAIRSSVQWGAVAAAATLVAGLGIVRLTGLSGR